MPRQPYLQLVSANASNAFSVGTEAIGKRPKLEKLVGDCLIAWPHVEAEMALYLGELLGTETASTLAVFQALRRSGTQRATIFAAGRIELNAGDLDLLEAILTIHKGIEAERTALAHGHFGVSDNVPDGILWMNTNDYVDLRLALNQKAPNDAILKKLLPGLWVYKADDLTAIFKEIKELARIWYNLARYDRSPEGASRAEFYDELIARPRIKTELARRSQASELHTPSKLKTTRK
jgi:hypothetical protein